MALRRDDKMKFQHSEDVLECGWFDVAFAQVILLPAGRREFDVTLPQTVRTCLNHIDESSPSTGHIRCRKSFILSSLRAYTTACVDIELQSVQCPLVLRTSSHRRSTCEPHNIYTMAPVRPLSFVFQFSPVSVSSVTRENRGEDIGLYAMSIMLHGDTVQHSPPVDC